jgi:hypothetical protein
MSITGSGASGSGSAARANAPAPAIAPAVAARKLRRLHRQDWFMVTAVTLARAGLGHNPKPVRAPGGQRNIFPAFAAMS